MEKQFGVVIKKKRWFCLLDKLLNHSVPEFHYLWANRISVISDRGWDGWMASPTHGREFEWTLGVGDGQGGLACCDSWGRKESDTTERLNWTELSWISLSEDDSSCVTGLLWALNWLIHVRCINQCLVSSHCSSNISNYYYMITILLSML